MSTAIITLDGSAQFNSGSPVHPLADDRFALLPGDSADFTFEDSRTVAEWATGWHRREKAPNEVKLVLLVRVEDQFDDGIGDYTHVYMGGYPIVPIEGDAAGWEVRGTRHVAHDEATPKVWSSVLPTRRHYFRSRAANQVLGADDA